MARFFMIPDRIHIDESLAIAKQYHLGFEFNDFWSPKVLDQEEVVQDLIDFYHSKELPDLLTSHGDFFDVLVFSEDVRIRQVAEERILQSLYVAEHLGASAVIFHTNYTPQLKAAFYMNNWLNCNETLWKKMLERFPRMNIYLENMFDEEPDALCELAKRLAGYANFGVCLDYAHASVFGKDLRRWVMMTAPYVRHLHINDNDLREDLHLAIGDGAIDWKQFAKDYEQYYQEATILIEVSDLEKLKKSLAFLEKLGLVKEEW